MRSISIRMFAPMNSRSDQRSMLSIPSNLRPVSITTASGAKRARNAARSELFAASTQPCASSVAVGIPSSGQSLVGGSQILFGRYPRHRWRPGACGARAAQYVKSARRTTSGTQVVYELRTGGVAGAGRRGGTAMT